MSCTHKVKKGVLLVSHIIVYKQSFINVLKQQLYCLVKHGKYFFWKKINGRSVSVIYDCFQTVIYGRFETANIWLNKTGCVLLEAYMDVPKRLHMSVSTLPYVDVPTHLHTFVLERRGRSETPSDNCFYTPRIWPRHISW